MHDTTEDRCFSKVALARYLDKSLRWVDYQLSGPNPIPGFLVPSANSGSNSKNRKKAWIFRKREVDAWLERFRTGVDLDRVVDETVAEVLSK